MSSISVPHYSNYGPILYHFRDKAKYLSKVTIFSRSYVVERDLGIDGVSICRLLEAGTLPRQMNTVVFTSG